MRKLLLCGALIAAASAAPAFAQDADPGYTVSGNVTIVSDYAWRNVSQSNQDWTVQGGIDFTASNGFYVGTWASGIDFSDEPEDANLELDLYGGFRFDLGGATADVGFLYYAYPDAETGDYNFYEIYGKLSKSWDQLSLGGSLNWDPDNETFYADASLGFAVTDAFSLSAGYGKYLEGFGEYAGWNVGGTLTVAGVALGLRYYDNDNAGDNDNVVFSIGRAF